MLTIEKTGKIVAAHLRSRDKKFSWIGYEKGLELFGQQLWQSGGKEIILTEGEIDCLTWSQVRDNRWPVVAVPGVNSIDMVKQNISFLSSFERVLLYFDMDEPGRAFAEEVAELLPPGKAFIGTTPLKDSNETYVEQGSKALFDTRWQAKEWSPPEVSSAWDVMNQQQATGTSYGGTGPHCPN